MINFDTSASDMPCTNPGFQPERRTEAYPLLEINEEGGCDDYEHDHGHSDIIDISTEREFYDENPHTRYEDLPNLSNTKNETMYLVTKKNIETVSRYGCHEIDFEEMFHMIYALDGVIFVYTAYTAIAVFLIMIIIFSLFLMIYLACNEDDIEYNSAWAWYFYVLCILLILNVFINAIPMITSDTDNLKEKLTYASWLYANECFVFESFNMLFGDFSRQCHDFLAVFTVVFDPTIYWAIFGALMILTFIIVEICKFVSELREEQRLNNPPPR